MKFIELTGIDNKKTAINPEYVIGIVKSEYPTYEEKSMYNPVRNKRESCVPKRIMHPCTRIHFVGNESTSVTESYETVKAMLEGATE